MNSNARFVVVPSGSGFACVDSWELDGFSVEEQAADASPVSREEAQDEADERNADYFRHNGENC